MNRQNPEPDADALAALIDSLMEQGTQHINLTVGAETRVQTVGSTECSPKGACAVPNLAINDEDAPEEPADML